MAKKIEFSKGFNPPPPKWVYEPVPDFSLSKHPKLEEDNYWDEQNRRWIEGHAGLTGAHYFYLQECFLNDIDGNVFRPEWRDVDEVMFRWVDECMESGESLLIYKRREIGCTSVFANLPYWFMKLYPGCRIGMTSGKGNDGISGMFNDKVIFSYNRFNPTVFNPKAVQLNNTKQLSSLEVSLKVWDDTFNREELRTSVLVCKETSEKPDSPTNLSGRRLRYCYVDEGPLHSRLDDFLGSILPVLNKGTERIGLLVIAGTVEPKLTTAETAAFYGLIQRSKNINFRTEMLPVWMGMVTKNGWSDEEAGMKWYWDNYNKFEQSGDMKGLRDFRMQYPKDEQDIFELSQGGQFENDVADILALTYKQLLEGKNEEMAYKLVAMNNSVEAIPDSKPRARDGHGNLKDGGHWIVEHPKPNVLYYQAIDGIGTGTKEGATEGSWIGCTIYKGFDPDGGSYTPVASYFERPETIEQGYIHMVNQWNYYNKYDGGKEINYESAQGTSDHFGTFLSKKGLYHYTYRRKDLSGKGNINKNKRGTAVNEHTREWQIRQGNSFLREYGSTFKSRIVLESLLKSASENADLRDAFFIFMVSIPNFDKPLTKTVKARDKFKLTLTTDASGATVYKKEAVPQPNRANEISADVLGGYVEELKRKYGDAYWYNKATVEEKERYRELKG